MDRSRERADPSSPQVSCTRVRECSDAVEAELLDRQAQREIPHDVLLTRHEFAPYFRLQRHRRGKCETGLDHSKRTDHRRIAALDAEASAEVKALGAIKLDLHGFE